MSNVSELKSKIEEAFSASGPVLDPNSFTPMIGVEAIINPEDLQDLINLTSEDEVTMTLGLSIKKALEKRTPHET